MKFKYAPMGVNMSRAFNGFTNDPAGLWDLYKCFYEDPTSGQTAEFYLNISQEGIAELVYKNCDKADILIEAFTKEMRGGNNEEEKVELIDWNDFSKVLQELAENKSQAISRHATGLLKSLKL